MTAFSGVPSLDPTMVRSGVMVGLVGLVVGGWSPFSGAAEPLSGAAEPRSAEGGAFVGWQEVQAAIGQDAAEGPRKNGGNSSAKLRGVHDDSFLLGAALPPPPRDAVTPSAVRVHPSSLAGLSSSVVPAVTGDLYWSRPVLDMRIIGQSLGQESALRLSRPPVGVSVGSTSVKPPVVGMK